MEARPHEMFDKIRQVNQAAIVDNKHLDAALAMAKMIQEQLPARKRNNNEPSTLSQPQHFFASSVAPEPKRKRGRPPLGQKVHTKPVMQVP